MLGRGNKLGGGYVRKGDMLRRGYVRKGDMLGGGCVKMSGRGCTPRHDH